MEENENSAEGKFIMVVEESDYSTRHVVGANFTKRLIFDPAVLFAMHAVKDFTKFCTSNGVAARGVKGVRSCDTARPQIKRTVKASP